MRVAELFNRALHLEGARVVGVEWVAGRLEVQVRTDARRAPRCSGCGQVVREIHDHRTRRWRHLDLARCRVVVVCRCARVRCLRCGVRTQALCFARPGSRFTAAFEDTCAWLTRHAPHSVVARLMRIDWETVGRIARRIVTEARGQGDGLEGLSRIGVDEVSWRAGHRDYLTVVVCHDSGRVVWVGHGPRPAALGRFFDALGPVRAARITTISADLGEMYLGVIRARAPRAEICADPFHIAAAARFALDRLRAAEWQRLRAEDPAGARWLRGARFALRRGAGRRSAADLSLIGELAGVNQPIYRAHLWCDQLSALMQMSDPAEAATLLSTLIEEAPSLGHRRFALLGRTLDRHRQSILNTIVHRISNGRIEALNSSVRLISHRARGFRHVDNLIAMIHLVCGRVRVELPT
jgi:transposase